MWSHVVVLSEPLIDDDLSLRRRGEPLGIEHLVAKGTVEAFIVSVLPLASGLPDLAVFILIRDLCVDSGRWCPLSLVDTIGVYRCRSGGAGGVFGMTMRSGGL